MAFICAAQLLPFFRFLTSTYSRTARNYVRLQLFRSEFGQYHNGKLPLTPFATCVNCGIQCYDIFLKSHEMHVFQCGKRTLPFFALSECTDQSIPSGHRLAAMP